MVSFMRLKQYFCEGLELIYFIQTLLLKVFENIQPCLQNNGLQAKSCTYFIVRSIVNA